MELTLKCYVLSTAGPLFNQNYRTVTTHFVTKTFTLQRTDQNKELFFVGKHKDKNSS